MFPNPVDQTGDGRKLDTNRTSGPPQESSARQLRILWIDDEIDLHNPLIRLLELDGLRISVANSGAEGLRIARADSFDVIVLDLRLPDLFGLTVLIRMRSAGLSVPVLVVTGCYFEREVEERAVAAGAVAVVYKPLTDPEHVALTLRTLAADRSLSTVSGRPPNSISPGPRQDVTARVGISRTRSKNSETDAAVARGVDGIFSGPAHVRVAKAIVLLARSADDVPTLARWAELVGPAQVTLENWCNAASAKPGHALRFARLLRASIRLQQFGECFQSSLGIADPRTLWKLSELAGVARPADLLHLTPERFLERQRALSAPAVTRLVGQLVVGQNADILR